MNILHIELVKEAIGSQSIQALRKIFEDRKGIPPAVPIRRFRADHEQWISILDSLERTHSLIERSSDHENYLIRPYAMPLIGTVESNEILTKMGEIYSKFHELYKEYLSSPIGLSIICNNIFGNEEVIQEALYYMSETHGVYSSITTGFPYIENSVIGLSEVSVHSTPLFHPIFSHSKLDSVFIS